MDLHLQVTAQSRETDEPQGEPVAAVERDVEEPGQIVQEAIREVLGFITNDDGSRAMLLAQVFECRFDIGPQLQRRCEGRMPSSVARVR